MAGAHAVTGAAVITIAITQKYIAPWFFLQHEGKVFCAHGGINSDIDVVCAHKIPHDTDGKLRFLFVVDDGRVVALEDNIGLAIKTLRNMFCHLI